MWSDIILGAIILAIVAAVIVYIYRAKKRGETCIGCPYAKQCGSGSCGGHRPQSPTAYQTYTSIKRPEGTR